MRRLDEIFDADDSFSLKWVFRGSLNVNKLDVQTEAEFEATVGSFNSLLVIDGKFSVNGMELNKGDSCFIPAGYGNYTVKGKGEIILTDII